MLTPKIKEDFPILKEEANGHPLVYLDNGATTQKPEVVLGAMTDYYLKANANPHRGSHYLSNLSTEHYENARQTVADFIGSSSEEVVFTRNTSESINLVAHGLIKDLLSEGDEVVTSIADHHSCMLPLRQVAQEKGAKLHYLAMTKDYDLDLSSLHEVINAHTKVIFLGHVSNVVGTLHPIEKIIQRGREVGAIILIDGAQAVPHKKVDVRQLDVDFYCFSGHKMLGPLGIGVLYGKKELLKKMKPLYYGGSMVEFVDAKETYLKESPHKFEAGTPPVAEAVGLAAAINYLQEVGMDQIALHEKEILDYALSKLKDVEDLTLYLPPEESRTSILAFSVKDVHPHDVAFILDMKGIAVRSGFHCAQPLHQHLDIPPTCRASFYLYNTKEDVDHFVQELKEVRRSLYGHS